MSIYYEKTKSNYSKDIDHLVTFNKNGLWIKENLNNGQRIISAQSIQENILKDITIYNFDKNYNLKEKYTQKLQILIIIFGNWKSINFQNKWKNTEEIILENLEINSIYTYEKITNLFKNFDTLSLWFSL